MDSNFRKKCAFVTAAILIMVFCHSAFVMAFSPDIDKPLPGFGGEMHRHPMSPYALWRNPRIVEDLKLTEDQVNKMKEADFTYREKNRELRAEIDLFDLKMEKAFSTEPVDGAAISKYAKKAADLRGKMFILSIQARLAVEKLLTPAQVKMLRADFRPPLTGKRGAPGQWGPPREPGPCRD
jgi:Spy/CpxP family protein refolding chaperone